MGSNQIRPLSLGATGARPSLIGHDGRALIVKYVRARPSEIPEWVALPPKMPGAVGSDLRGFAVLGSERIRGRDALASENGTRVSRHDVSRVKLLLS